jgi:iron-sulfur cluster repair protein YtfE (RIC family)
MLMKQWDTKLQEALDPQGLCMLIENECQREIRTSCKQIADYLAISPNKEVPDPVYELVQLLFTKLQDEVEHLFLKETGIIFPAIKNAGPDYIIPPKVPENIHQTQQGIINLLQKLRQLLNNYVVQPGWSKPWRACVNELFVLEREVHQWIYIEQSLLYPSISEKKQAAE